MIAIDPTKGNSVELTDEIVNNIVADVKSSIPVKEGGEVYYPGELELLNIKQNKEEGIPVIEEKWEEVLNMVMVPEEKQATPQVAFVFLGPLTNELSA